MLLRMLSITRPFSPRLRQNPHHYELFSVVLRRTLTEQQPPKKRKQLADALAPVHVRLQQLRAKGWTYEQLAKELNEFGLPVKPAALRDYLTTQKAMRPNNSRERITAISKPRDSVQRDR